MTINKENLFKLADFLETEVEDENFDMSCFNNSNIRLNQYRDAKFCAWCTCCALGWAPFALNDLETKTSNWADYVKEKFGIEILSDTYDYLFLSQWKVKDNTRESAINRIREVAFSGVPSSFYSPSRTIRN